jgi:aconitate hydratase
MDAFHSRSLLKIGDQTYTYFSLDALEQAGLVQLNKLPYSIRLKQFCVPATALK